MPVLHATRLHQRFATLSPGILTLLALAGCGSHGLTGLAQLPPTASDARTHNASMVQAAALAQMSLRSADLAVTTATAGAQIGTLNPSTGVPAAGTLTAINTVAANAAPPQSVPVAPLARNVAAAVPVPATPNASTPQAALPGLPALQGMQDAAAPALQTVASAHTNAPIGLAVSAASLRSQVSTTVNAATMFQENFTDGLSRWRIGSPPGAAVAGDPAAAWSIVDNEGPDVVGAHTLALTNQGPLTLTQRTFYMQTQKIIDLKSADQPKLRLVVKNGESSSASFKVVWQSADPAHPEETLIATRFEATSDWTPREFDLARLKGQAGRLILVAKASQGAVPMIDEVSIYDAK
jgi:hypothetical protein